MAYTSPSLTASGATFSALQKNGATGHLELLIAQQAATADPTVAPTLSSSGTGNTLPTATYWVQVSETNGIGETKPIAASASQAITLGAALVVTFQSLKTGNTARNVYVSATGSSGPWTLAGAGVTASSLTVSAPLPTDSRSNVSLPAVNTTGLTYTDANGKGINRTLSMIRSVERGNAQDVWEQLAQTVSNYLRGEAVDVMALRRHVQQAQAAYQHFVTTCSEIGTLLDANPGTLSTVATGSTNRKTVRTFP